EVRADGYGQPQRLPEGINSRAGERSPTPVADGTLLFSSDRRSGAGGIELYRARLDGNATAAPVPASHTRADERDSPLLDGGRAAMGSRGEDGGAMRVYVATCDGSRFADAQPWALSFNSDVGHTRAPVADPSRPKEGTVTGSAPSPKAGR